MKKTIIVLFVVFMAQGCTSFQSKMTAAATAYCAVSPERRAAYRAMLNAEGGPQISIRCSDEN